MIVALLYHLYTPFCQDVWGVVIPLFENNQTAYEAAVAMLFETGKGGRHIVPEKVRELYFLKVNR